MQSNDKMSEKLRQLFRLMNIHPPLVSVCEWLQFYCQRLMEVSGRLMLFGCKLQTCNEEDGGWRRSVWKVYAHFVEVLICFYDRL